MKKSVLLVLTAVFYIAVFSACQKSPVEIKTVEIDGMEYRYFQGLSVLNTPGRYTEAVIPDQDTASEYAKAIFQGLKNGRLAKKYVPTELFFDEEQEVWITTFSRKGQDLEKTEGDCYRIAVQKSDGTVLRIWYEK